MKTNLLILCNLTKTNRLIYTIHKQQHNSTMMTIKTSKAMHMIMNKTGSSETKVNNQGKLSLRKFLKSWNVWRLVVVLIIVDLLFSSDFTIS